MRLTLCLCHCVTLMDHRGSMLPLQNVLQKMDCPDRTQCPVGASCGSHMQQQAVSSSISSGSSGGMLSIAVRFNSGGSYSARYKRTTAAAALNAAGCNTHRFVLPTTAVDRLTRLPSHLFYWNRTLIRYHYLFQQNERFYSARRAPTPSKVLL